VVGRTRIYNVASGALVRLLKAGSSSTAVRFSPSGQYLALNDSNILTNGIIGGVRVVRVSDWTLAMTTGNGSRLVAWSGGGAAIWTKNNWDGSDSHAGRWSSRPARSLATW
jgi:dipeptidyl aminopeptidase/acylaminoacyl peptidase